MVSGNGGTRMDEKLNAAHNVAYFVCYVRESAGT